MKRIMTSFLSFIIAISILSSCNKPESIQSESTANDTTTSLETTGIHPTFDIYEYERKSIYWSTENISWDLGGYVLELKCDNESQKVVFTFSLTQAAPDSRVAYAIAEMEISKINSNEILLSFADDDWGHSGNIKLIFSDDNIFFKIDDIQKNDPDSFDVWGFSENSGSLVANPEAKASLEYTQEDYDAIYGANSTPIYSEPSYDPNKASGILASMGMTEEEFRASCMPLNPTVYPGTIIKKGTTVQYVELYELERNPNAYIGQHFVFATNPFENLPCRFCHGEDLTETPKDPCSHKDISDEYRATLHDDGLYYRYQYNLNKLVPYELLGKDRFTNIYGDSVISGRSNSNYLVFDLRDDIYSPNITDDSTVIAYMIFNGISDNMLIFSMISCDILYE